MELERFVMPQYHDLAIARRKFEQGLAHELTPFALVRLRVRRWLLRNKLLAACTPFLAKIIERAFSAALGLAQIVIAKVQSNPPQERRESSRRFPVCAPGKHPGERRLR